MKCSSSMRRSRPAAWPRPASFPIRSSCAPGAARPGAGRRGSRSTNTRTRRPTISTSAIASPAARRSCRSVSAPRRGTFAQLGEEQRAMERHRAGRRAAAGQAPADGAGSSSSGSDPNNERRRRRRHRHRGGRRRMTTLLHIADRVLNRPLLIHPDKAAVILAVIEGRIGVARGRAHRRRRRSPGRAHAADRGLALRRPGAARRLLAHRRGRCGHHRHRLAGEPRRLGRRELRPHLL
jgi:hypothetical protein